MSRDVHRYPVYRNTGILCSVLPVIPVSTALRYTGNGIFMTSVYRCTGIFPSVFFSGFFFQHYMHQPHEIKQLFKILIVL